MESTLASRIEALRQELRDKRAVCDAEATTRRAVVENALDSVRTAQHAYVEALYVNNLFIKLVRAEGEESLKSWAGLGYLLQRVLQFRNRLLSAQAQVDQARAALDEMRTIQARVNAETADIRARCAQLAYRCDSDGKVRRTI